MNDDTQNTGAQKAFSDEHPKHVGPILGVLVIILALILGGLYLWGSMLGESENQARVERVMPNNEPETPRAEADKQIMGTVSSSDEISAIEADLYSTNLDGLDGELEQIKIELEAKRR